ncbi:helix-turn-helix domain-containing protein [Phenylobacterium sp.]|uniref:helix-turn-helix domain-containing protein n=1 Tax=Phenylobacterium sp. TaxID=1871053 RepID=UPI003BA91070
MRKLVGRNARRMRVLCGLTQEQLSEQTGLTQQYISGLEQGRRNPTILTLFDLAQALRTTPAALITPEEVE